MAGKTDLESSIAGLSDVDSGDYFTTKEGKNRIRILPSWTSKGPHAGRFFFKGILHYGFKVEGRGRAFPCLIMFDEHAACPSCAFAEALKDNGSEELDKIAQRVRSKSKYYVNVLDRKNPANKIQIYGMTRTMMRTLRGYLQDPDYGDITDPEEGRDLTIEKTGSGLATKYEIRISPKTSPIGIEDWKTQLHKLSKVVIDPIDKKTMVKHLRTSYGKVYSKLMGADTKPKEPEDEEEDIPF